MDNFSQELVRIRLELSFKTTKSFYNYLKSRGLECNYQYFVKIIKGQTFPTHVIVNQIIKPLNTEQAETLIKAYCGMQFHQHSYLFKKEISTISDSQINTLEINQGQKVLSSLQISTLAKCKENYFLFLILTLSRKGLILSEIKDLNKKFHQALKDLVNTQIAFIEKDYLFSTSNEFRFPKNDDNEIIGYYRKFDEWDLIFGDEFKFKNILNKMMIRRISPRYLSLITKQIELLSDQVRMSDETERNHNSEVIQLHIRLNTGKILG